MTINELTLKKFIALRQILEDTQATEESKQLALVSVYAEKSPEDVEQWPLPVFYDVLQDVIKLLSVEPKADKSKLKDVYVFENKRFILLKDPGKNNVKAFIDAIALFSDVENLTQNMPKLLAISLLPAIEKPRMFGKRYYDYGSYDVTEAAEIIADNITVGEALAISDFFLTNFLKSLKRSIKATQTRLKTMSNIQIIMYNITRKQRYKAGSMLFLQLHQSLAEALARF